MIYSIYIYNYNIYIYIYHKLTTKAGGPILYPQKCQFCLVERLKPHFFLVKSPHGASRSSACSEPDLPQPVDLQRRCRRFEGTTCGTEGTSWTQLGVSMEGHGIIGEPELKVFWLNDGIILPFGSENGVQTPNEIAQL